jgi:hypothetical protein
MEDKKNEEDKEVNGDIENRENEKKKDNKK